MPICESESTAHELEAMIMPSSEKATHVTLSSWASKTLSASPDLASRVRTVLSLEPEARACGPGQQCVHYVIVTNEQCADAWSGPSHRHSVDARFSKVRQWVLVVDKKAVVEATRGEKV